MIQLLSFCEVLPHVFKGFKAYVAAEGPLCYLKSTRDGVKLGQVGSNELIMCPLTHTVYQAKYIKLDLSLALSTVLFYLGYTCVKATNDVTTLFTVFDYTGNKVHEGNELYGVFSLQEWVDALPSPF
jgi:hypothetical protein